MTMISDKNVKGYRCESERLIWKYVYNSSLNCSGDSCAVMRYNGRYVGCGETTGKITLRCISFISLGSGSAFIRIRIHVDHFQCVGSGSLLVGRIWSIYGSIFKFQDPDSREHFYIAGSGSAPIIFKLQDPDPLRSFSSFKILRKNKTLGI